MVLCAVHADLNELKTKSEIQKRIDNKTTNIYELFVQKTVQQMTSQQLKDIIKRDMVWDSCEQSKVFMGCVFSGLRFD